MYYFILGAQSAGTDPGPGPGNLEYPIEMVPKGNDSTIEVTSSGLKVTINSIYEGYSTDMGAGQQYNDTIELIPDGSVIEFSVDPISGLKYNVEIGSGLGKNYISVNASSNNPAVLTLMYYDSSQQIVTETVPTSSIFAVQYFPQQGFLRLFRNGVKFRHLA